VPIDPRTIVDYLRDEAGRPLKAKELARALSVPESDFGAFREQLERLEAEGVLYSVQRQRYAAPEKINLTVGRLQTTRGGAGFLIPEDRSRDVYIPMQALNTALDGDRVVVRVESRPRGDRPEGRVIRVLERSRETVVGVFHGVRPGKGVKPGKGAKPGKGVKPGKGRRSGHGFVVPEDRKLPWDVFVAPGGGGEAAEGDLVVVRITDWGSGHRGPTGEVEEVLGRPGEPGVDVLSIIRCHEAFDRLPRRGGTRGGGVAGPRRHGRDLADRTDLREALIVSRSILPTPAITTTPCPSSGAAMAGASACTSPTCRTMSGGHSHWTARRWTAGPASIWSTASYRCCRTHSPPTSARWSPTPTASRCRCSSI
jgi:ribonuclease R